MNKKKDRLVIASLVAILAILLLLELVFVTPEGHVIWHTLPFSHAVMGILFSIIFILVAKPLLNKILMRSEHYYKDKGGK